MMATAYYQIQQIWHTTSLQRWINVINISFNVAATACAQWECYFENT